MPSHVVRRAVLGLAVAVVLTGCGGNSLSEEDQKVADSLAAYAISQSNGVWNKREAQCMADRFVKSAGVDELKKAELVTAKNKANPAKVTLSQPLAAKFADAVMACVDFADLSARQIAAVRPDIDSGKFAACVRESVSKKAARGRLIAQQMNDPDAGAYRQTNQLMLKCAEDSRLAG